MAGFGGAVKLTGETEYKKALSQITQSLKVVSAEMKATATSFDAGEKSEKDLANASKDLKANLEQQKTALASVKGQLADLTAEYQKAGQKHQDLVNKYDAEKKKLDEIGRTLGTSSNEYKEQQKVVDELSKEVTKSGKEYDKLGKDVNTTRIQIAKAETTINETSKSLEDMGEKAEKSSEGFTVMKGVLANLATDAIRSAINGLKQLGGAFVDVGKQALDSYGQYEQLEGGVKKIFGDDMAQTVIQNAQNAFSTAGMSANEYMETVTGFSSSLIQSLDGDTAKAAQISDRAIRDMSDNANTFGTDMASIQNAYQGFAKGNYTMLDNLKLG